MDTKIIRTELSDKRLMLLIISVLCIMNGGCKSDSQEYQERIPTDIIKQIIDHKALQQYLHPEVEGRKPLIIADHLVDPGVSIVKFTMPVKVLPKTELRTNAYMEFTKFARSGNKAKIEMKYAVEGLICSFDFIKDRDGNWEIKNVRIWEI